jgi:transposase-like protein
MVGYAGKQRYVCKTCGVDVAPYDQYCDRHRAIAAISDTKPALLDRVMNRIVGR